MWEKNSKVFTCLAILLALSFDGQAQRIPETIVYGTVYNIFHDRFSTDEVFSRTVAEDMRNIRQANFNLVMPFPFGQWNVETRQPDWERTDVLVDALEENDLMLMPIMLKSTHRAYLPTWRWVEIPDAVREFPEVSRTSEDVKYMHPEVLKEIEAYFKSVAARYGKRSSLVGYNLWNEAHYESIDEITIPKFREWLEDKYGSLKELNRVWAEDYSQWSQITPLMSRNWESSMAQIDWDLFRFANNGDIASWAYQTMRKYDSVHFNTINTVGTVINNPNKNQWSVDGRQIAPHTDVFGISFYPDKYMNRHKKPMPYWQYSSMYDVTRSDAGQRPWYLVEAQTNQQNGMGLFQFMSYDDIHLLSWMAFADNCKGIVFWKWKPFYRGQQAFGRGLTYADGTLAPRGEAAKDVGSVLKKYGKLLFDFQLKPAEVGILYDIVALQKSLEVADNPASRNTTDFFMNESFEGTYKALFDKNVTVDVVRTDMPLSMKLLEKYKILFLPYQLVIRDDVAEMLKEYVRNGGWLVADARSAIMDQYDFGFPENPGFGLDAVFGARRLDLYAADSVFTLNVVENELFDESFTKGDTLNGIYFQEKLRLLEGGEVMARFKNGDPAVVFNKVGKGMAVLSAVPLGGSYYHGLERAGDLISGLAFRAGVAPSAHVSSTADTDGLMIKVHTNDTNEALVYVINTSGKPFSGSIRIPRAQRRPRQATELIQDKRTAFKVDKQDVLFDVDISPYRTQVYHLK